MCAGVWQIEQGKTAQHEQAAVVYLTGGYTVLTHDMGFTGLRSLWDPTGLCAGPQVLFLMMLEKRMLKLSMPDTKGSLVSTALKALYEMMLSSALRVCELRSGCCIHYIKHLTHTRLSSCIRYVQPLVLMLLSLLVLSVMADLTMSCAFVHAPRDTGRMSLFVLFLKADSTLKLFKLCSPTVA